MKVLVGPRADLDRRGIEWDLAQLLAGKGGEVVSLSRVGVANLLRPLSSAEVAWLRGAMAGEDALVGYVCKGVGLGSGKGNPERSDRAGAVCVVAVSDHVNLTWRSPLTGPNDDRVGPRFPSMTGIYDPGTVQERLGTADGIIVTPGVVAGVGDDWSLNPYEAHIAGVSRHLAASSELVPVVIVAAHMGLRTAAAVVIMGGSPEEEIGSGRS